MRMTIDLTMLLLSLAHFCLFSSLSYASPSPSRHNSTIDILGANATDTSQAPPRISETQQRIQIPYTDIVLYVDQPFGGQLPQYATNCSLAAALSGLIEEITIHGDRLSKHSHHF